MTKRMRGYLLRELAADFIDKDPLFYLAATQMLLEMEG
jgi:hypothetical protein